MLFRSDGLSVVVENLCWLVKTRCVLFSFHFLQGKLSTPPANPVLAGKNLIGGAKVIRFYNQIGPTRIRPLRIPYPGTHKRERRCKSAMFYTSDRLPLPFAFTESAQKPCVFGICGAAGAQFLCLFVAKYSLNHILVRIVYFSCSVSSSWSVACICVYYGGIPGVHFVASTILFC